MTDTANATAETASTWWAARADEQCAHVTLYRVTGAKEELLDRVTVTPDTVPTLDDFQLMVKAEYGGGEYLAVQRGEQGQYLMRQRFAVAGFAKKQTPPPEEARQAEAGGFDKLAAMLLQQQAASEERMARLIEQIAAPKTGSTMADTLGMVEQVASILGKTGAAPQPQKGLLEQLTELRQAADLIGLTDKGSEAEGFSLADALGKLADVAPLMLGAGKGQSGGDTAEPDSLPPPADPQAAMVEKARRLLRGLIQLARYKVAPADTVEDVQAQAGTAWPMVQELLHRDDFVQIAAGLVPEVAQHGEWFEGFRQAVIAPPAEEDKDTAAQGRRTKRARA